MGNPKFILLVFASFFTGSLFARPATDAVPSADQAYNHALAIVLGNDQTEIVDKRVGPIRAIATCQDEGSRDVVNRAVAEVNDAFGYGKIALSWSDNARLEDDAVTIYIGPKKIGRQLIERFGVSSPRAFGSSTYYYWWENQRPNHIRRCLIAADNLLPGDRQLEDLRYLLLACMGFKSPWSSKQLQRVPRDSDTAKKTALTKLDTAIIRFFDKHVPAGARARDMRNAFKSEWPDFSAAYYNPQTKVDSNEAKESASASRSAP